MKTSDDLEVYEIEQPSKEKLEEICDLRQPVLFNFNNDKFNEMLIRNKINEYYGAFDVKVRNVLDHTDDTELYIPLTFSATSKLFDSDKKGKFITEHNHDFLEETALIKTFRYNDAFLRPSMVSNCMYDYISASTDTITPLRYNVNYRNYYYVSEGNITIKITPPSNTKYLNMITDYDNSEIRSPMNPWSIQPQYRADYDKVKFLEVHVKKGDMFFIPAYWWYSIKFGDNTSICTFKYRTYMNVVAIAPYLIMCMLQRQNVKRDICKKMELAQLSNTEPIAVPIAVPNAASNVVSNV